MEDSHQSNHTIMEDRLVEVVVKELIGLIFTLLMLILESKVMML